jgi:hypothetical protein
MLSVPVVSSQTGKWIPPVDEIDGYQWLEWSPRVRNQVALGMIFTSFMWTESIWVMHEHGLATDDMLELYQELGSLTEMSSMVLYQEIDRYYLHGIAPMEAPLTHVVYSVIADFDERQRSSM